MWQSIKDTYNYIFYDLANPITRDWLFAGSPLQLFIIIVIYVYFSTRLGPWYMRNKQPYGLKNVIKVYNLFQTITNACLCYAGVKHVISNNYNVICTNVEDPDTAAGQQIALLCWIYFVIKLVDYADTIFYVLRKSNRQITFLHLHHHVAMTVIAWVALTYFPGGSHTTFVGCINTFVHAVMYVYYFIAGLGEEYKKYVWWKKHVTQLQMAQFTIVSIQSTCSLFVECNFPLWVKISVTMYSLTFAKMFGEFYYYNYIVKKDQKNGKHNSEMGTTILNREDKQTKIVKNYANGEESINNSKNSNGQKTSNKFRNGLGNHAKVE